MNLAAEISTNDPILNVTRCVHCPGRDITSDGKGYLVIDILFQPSTAAIESCAGSSAGCESSGRRHPGAGRHKPQRKCHTCSVQLSATSPPTARASAANSDWQGRHWLAALDITAHSLAHSSPSSAALAHTIHNASSVTPPIEAATPRCHHHPRTTICLLAMPTRIYRRRERNHACAAHRPDDTRAATHLTLPSDPAALLQAS